MNGRAFSLRNIIIYCVLAYALFWIPFFGATLAGRGDGDPGAWAAVFGVVGPYSPLIAALIMRVLISREGFADAHLGIRRTRWYFWLLAILLPFFWNGVQDLLQLLFGFASVEWAKVGGGLYRVPINLFGGLFIFIGEEFGWRSYLLERLRPLGRWKALLWSGIIWSLWHTPILLMPGGVYTKRVDLAGAALALVVFVLAGFIFGWLYLESKSVWPCVLMHSYNNLIAMKLFREAWTVETEPTLLQNSLMAFGPMLLVWLVLYVRGGFGFGSGGRAAAVEAE
ncbi:MAG TPA: CPBP family intramembrane metalloprotease [Candidatus Eisenbacteria bacterium]|uniref:CPBP family intramembrane metalloprotease n=1 Tax=Eiseniibacteriota bacterium TaxID=2212470 RepID=A0A7V2AVS2_UNCEI|nr:CPBP family intramembrane metalloprotease [Candidatus Eisenbacteria bacterium]